LLQKLTSITKGQDAFDILTTYLEKHGLSWDSCVEICTDGAPSMVGSIKGFVSLVEKRNPTVLLRKLIVFFTQGSVNFQDRTKGMKRSVE